MAHKNGDYFGLSNSDGEVEKQEPGFHKGMLLKKKKTSDEEDVLTTNGSSDNLIPREVC
jgi:hypothetical protein